MSTLAHRSLTVMNAGMLIFLIMRDVGAPDKAAANVLVAIFACAGLVLFSDILTDGVRKLRDSEFYQKLRGNS